MAYFERVGVEVPAMTDTELREKLVAEDDEYRHLSTKHRNYEQRLTQLTRKNALTPVEDMERINLKKRTPVSP